jgi:hypothetical protein
MKSDNSSYTVTSPDLLLTEDGISVLITSTDKPLIENIKAIYEKYINTSIVFNVNSVPTTEKSISWMWYVSRAVDMMIVDLDTCAWEDVCTAMTKNQDENHVVVFLNQKNKKPAGVRLINATSEYLIIDSIEMFDAYLASQLQAA